MTTTTIHNPVTLQAADFYGGPSLSVVNNDDALKQKDVAQISTPSRGEFRDYKPTYEFGKGEYCCGAWEYFELKEKLPAQDAYKLRDQMKVSVYGLDEKTPELYKQAKPFKNLPSYAGGSVDRSESDSSMVTVYWRMPDNEIGDSKAAVEFCRKNNLKYTDNYHPGQFFPGVGGVPEHGIVGSIIEHIKDWFK